MKGILPEEMWKRQMEERFSSFAASFFPDSIPDMAQRKIEHTIDVCRITERILAEEKEFASIPAGARLGYYCALFHDLSRFEQLAKYATLRDQDSFDHGKRSREILEEELFPMPRELSPREKVILLTAVEFHNKKALPPDLPSDILPFAKLIRDADKLSILKVVMAAFADEKACREGTVSFGLPWDAPYTVSIAEKAIAGEMIDYTTLKCVDDFKISLFVWPVDLTFGTSAKIAKEEKLFENFAGFLPDDPLMRELKRSCLARLDLLAAGGGEGGKDE